MSSFSTTTSVSPQQNQQPVKTEKPYSAFSGESAFEGNGQKQAATRGLFINTNFSSSNSMGAAISASSPTCSSSIAGAFFGLPSTTRSIEALLVTSSPAKLATAENIDLMTTAHAQINAKLDRGFFINENQEWTSYRRNYFKISVGFTLHTTSSPSTGTPLGLDGGHQDLHLARNGHEFKSFQVSLVGRTNDSDKTVELIQHTPKRDKNAINTVRPMTLAPGGNCSGHSDLSTPPPSGTTIAPTIVTFDRVQFKKATANNGKRKAAQQFYSLDVELYGITQSDERVLISVLSSAPLVIRGRSPGHYSSKTLQIQIDGAPLSAGPTSAASTSVPESPFSAIPSASLFSPQRSNLENGFSSFSINCTNNSPLPLHNSYTNSSFTRSPTSKLNSNRTSPASSPPQQQFSTFSAASASASIPISVPSGNNNWLSIQHQQHSFSNESSPQPHSYVHQQTLEQSFHFDRQHQQQALHSYSAGAPSSRGYGVNYGSGYAMLPFQQKMQQQQMGYIQHQENNLVLTSPFPAATPTSISFQGFFPETGSFYREFEAKQQYLTSSPPSDYLRFPSEEQQLTLGMSMEQMDNLQ